jgi:xanthine dehydrogenase accessory factor
MKSNHELYKTVFEELEAGRRVVVLTELSSKSGLLNPPVKSLLREIELVKQEGTESIDCKLSRAAIDDGRLQCFDDKHGTIVIAEPYFPESRLTILGGGHIAKPLAEFSSKCGYSVTVVDDRPAFANNKRFPYANNVFCESFDRCFPLLNVNRSAFVVIITRGHRHDIDCLRQVLKLETAYTGMIGSRRRVSAAMEQLFAEGYPREKLDAVRAPIGIDIGAQTPEEIAVSILSEVIQYKRKSKNSNWPELDNDVLSELIEERDDPKALVTIIETKGSVPRDVGAKMIVWPHGKTLGSIGGGCSESSVIQSAYDVIRDGGYRIVDIDMTGEIAENDGMVCGGTMKAVIEQYS